VEFESPLNQRQSSVGVRHSERDCRALLDLRAIYQITVPRGTVLTHISQESTSIGESCRENGRNPRNLWVLSSRRHFLLFSNKKISLKRFRDQYRFSPLPVLQFSHYFQISSPDPEDHFTRLNPFRPGPFKKWLEFTDRSRADIVQRRYFLSQFFVATD
jgi:hypothetical protein